MELDTPKNRITDAEILKFQKSLDENDRQACHLLAKWSLHMPLTMASTVQAWAMRQRVSEGPETYRMHWKRWGFGQALSIPKDLAWETDLYVRTETERWKVFLASGSQIAEQKSAARARMPLFHLGGTFEPFTFRDALLAVILYGDYG